jgi:hypothetical protein
MSACPLCDREIKKPKVVYGHAICKKCWAGYINRRQVAYVIDTLVIVAAMLLTGYVSRLLFGTEIIWLQFCAGVLLNAYWLGRDGLNGRSPGKVCMNLEVVDGSSGAAIGWTQAFLRNWPLAVSTVVIVVAQFLQLVDTRGENVLVLFPLALSGFGVLLGMITVLIIAIQMNNGPRWGDGFADTRVIWRRYADSPVFNPAVAESGAMAPEFAPAMRGGPIESANDPYRAPRT